MRLLHKRRGWSARLNGFQFAEQRVRISPDPPTEIHELNHIEPAFGVLCF